MSWKPEGYHSILPYLTVNDPQAALAFYERAFGAETTLKLMMGDRVGHAEIRIGGAHVMISGEWPDMHIRGPNALGGASSSLTIYVPDADAAYAKAVAEGAEGLRPPEDQFYGDRMGMVTDPFGHRWSLHTHQRLVSPEEMQAAMDAWGAAQAEAQPS